MSAGQRKRRLSMGVGVRQLGLSDTVKHQQPSQDQAWEEHQEAAVLDSPSLP